MKFLIIGYAILAFLNAGYAIIDAINNDMDELTIMSWVSFMGLLILINIELKSKT